MGKRTWGVKGSVQHLKGVAEGRENKCVKGGAEMGKIGGGEGKKEERRTKTKAEVSKQSISGTSTESE